VGIRRSARFVWLAVLVAASVLIIVPGQASASTRDGVDSQTPAVLTQADVVPGEVLVQLKSGFPDLSVRQAFGRSHHMNEAGAIPGLNWFKFTYTDGTSPMSKAA
jgi:hypothetical protein